MIIDPVCGMQVDPKKPGATSVYKGQTYYFCSTGCKADFDKNPEQYLPHKHEGMEHQHPH